MNRQLTTEELGSLLVTDKPVSVMTRHEKLMRFAELVRNNSRPMVIFNALEYYHDYQLSGIRHPDSAFALAASDPQFQAAGLRFDDVKSAMEFFELTKDELHEFSCDCGGLINNANMARRIEHLAHR